MAAAVPARDAPVRQRSLRTHNLGLVLRQVAASPTPVSRADVAAATGLTKATVSTLEGEHLLVPDRAEALPWARGRPDLHAVTLPQVVDDVDSGRRDIRVRHVAVPPFAHRADPRRQVVHADPGPACQAGRRKRVDDAGVARIPSGGYRQMLVAERQGRVRGGTETAARDGACRPLHGG